MVLEAALVFAPTGAKLDSPGERSATLGGRIVPMVVVLADTDNTMAMGTGARSHTW
jgi:hypothetical protein